MNRELTPQKAAKKWAKENPKSTAKIQVLSLVPKGRGGRNGLGLRTSTFYCHNGELRQPKPVNWNPYVGDFFADDDPIKGGWDLPLVTIDLRGNSM
jgi:hypothetical protein